MQKTKTNNLKVAGYLSIAIGLIILLNYDILGAIPFAVNAYYLFRYISNNLKEKEVAVVFSIIMLLLNFIYFLIDDVWVIVDVIAWSYFSYIWYKN